jgi:hypothetical protein
MEIKYLAASLLEFFESNPGLFVRCDRDGKENPEGEFLACPGANVARTGGRARKALRFNAAPLIPQ